MRKTVLIFSLFSLSGCSFFATSFAPKRIASDLAEESELEKESEKVFWETFHQGDYVAIPKVIEKLSQAYFQDSDNVKTVAHLGFTNLWGLSERARVDGDDAGTPLRYITDSQKYFSEAQELAESDPRILMFSGLAKMTQGSISDDEKLTRKGFFDAKQAVKEWPQFNKFSWGYFFSGSNRTSDRFQQSLRYQKETMEDCFCEKLDIDSYDFEANLNKIINNTDPEIYRACWNSWIAPHNWEGFMLNYGDMLVKNGDLERAKKVYNLAKLSPAFEEWPYAETLEMRIVNAAVNIDLFRTREKSLMAGTAYSCMGCHQKSSIEFQSQGLQSLSKEYYFLP